MGSEADLLAALSPARALATVREICSFGPRWPGSAGERRTREYLRRELDSIPGLAWETEEFPYLQYQPGVAQVRVSGSPEEVFSAQALIYAAPTADGPVAGQLVYVGEGRAEDYERLGQGGARGKVVLSDATRSYLAYPEAVRQGAVAFVLGTALPPALASRPGVAPGDLIRVGTASYSRTLQPIPGVSVSGRAGDELREVARRGGTVAVSLEATFRQSFGQNLIARYRGGGASAGRILVFAHYDSMWVGPHCFDDATGVAGVLELARAVAAARFPADLDFLWFGAEELGFWGSLGYVRAHERELTGVKALLCLDGFCSSLLEREIGVSPRLSEAVRSWVAAGNHRVDKWSVPPRPASDHVPFAELDIPVVWVTGFDPFYHTAGDTPDHLDEKAVREGLLLAAETLVRLVEA